MSDDKTRRRPGPWEEYPVDRYVGQDQETIARHLAEDQQLCRHLGMELAGAGPGITIATPTHGIIECDTEAWDWLRPLLAALAAHTPSPDQEH